MLFVTFTGFAVCLALLACFVDVLPGLVIVVIVSGLLLGVINTALTEAVMEATDLPRNVASWTYSGVRFIGGAIAPAVAGPLSTSVGEAAPYWLGAGAVLIAIVALATSGKHLAHIGRVHDTAVEEAQAITVGDGA